MQYVLGEVSLSSCPHCLHPSSQAPTPAFRVIYANMHHVRGQEHKSAQDTVVVPKQLMLYRGEQAPLTTTDSSVSTQVSTRAQSTRGRG